MSNQPQAEGQFKKDLRKIDIWALALGAIIGWGCFVMPGTSFLPKAGPIGSIVGLMLGALIISIISFSYGYMIQKLSLIHISLLTPRMFTMPRPIMKA